MKENVERLVEVFGPNIEKIIQISEKVFIANSLPYD